MGAMAGFSALNRSKESPHESSDCSIGVLTGGEICWGGLPKIGKVGECFQWRSHNEWLYGQTEATTGFSTSNMSKEPRS